MDKRLILVLSTLAVGTCLAVWMKYRQAEMPELSQWKKSLSVEEVDSIRLEYRHLLQTVPRPANKSLRRHLTQVILPRLALYHVLLMNNGGEHQSALAEVDCLLREEVLMKNHPLRLFLRLLPDPFAVFQPALKVFFRDFPSEGWPLLSQEFHPDRIAFSYSGCYYHDLLSTLGAPELTLSFCKTDDYIAELFPPGIRFTHPHTIGQGDAICEFEYRQVR